MKKEIKKSSTKKNAPVKVTKKVKKEKKEEAPKTFITPEEMTEELMMSLLLELQDTPYWNAILKFSSLKDADTIATLASVDPFKDPTTTARTQGSRIGIYLLQNTIFEETKRRNEEATKNVDEPKLKTQGY